MIYLFSGTQENRDKQLFSIWEKSPKKNLVEVHYEKIKVGYSSIHKTVL